MAMNKANYKQYDTRWASLGYPKKPWYIRNCGCGEVSVCNCIIEMDKYKNATPKTIQPYCKQYAAPNGNGTYFAGIPKMMAHYGMTEVKEHATMDTLWKELKKGNRVAIYLMGSRKGGSKGVHWTSSAHFVCSVGYKVKDGKHYVYVKDSNSTSSLRNGFISYEENMRGDVSRVWSAKLPTEKPKVEASVTPKETPQDKMCAWAKKIAKDDSYHYVYYDKGKKAHECPICHKHPKGTYHGWNCIGYAWASWRHGAGIKCRCSCDTMTNQLYERMMHISMKDALKIVRDRIGIKSVKLIRSKSKGIKLSSLQKGDIIVYFKGNDYVHTALYVGDGKIADCTSARKDGIKYGVKSYTKWKIKLAIRYTGK